MKNSSIIEIILNSKDFLSLARQKELVEWLTTTIQPMIGKQELLENKLFLNSFKNSPPIHLS